MAKRLLKHVMSLGPGGTGRWDVMRAPKAALTSNGTSTDIDERSESFAMCNTSSSQESFSPVHRNGLLVTEPLENGSQNTQEQMTELSWSDMEASFFPYEWAIQDMFDFGMPNIFRDPMI